MLEEMALAALMGMDLGVGTRVKSEQKQEAISLIQLRSWKPVPGWGLGTQGEVEGICR